MERCCICGNDTGANEDGLLINGKAAPICKECGAILDDVEKTNPQDPKRNSLRFLLNGKMKNSGASYAVVDAVNEICSVPISENINNFMASEKAEYEREKQEEKEIAEAASGNPIESLCSFLSVFAVVFLIGGLILSFVLGVPLTKVANTRANGWGVIIGGIIGTILAFAMIMLVLSVASAIGKINDKMDITNERINNTNKQLGKIINMLSSSESHKTKK